MKTLLLFALILLTSCSKPRELVGKWQVKDYTLWEKVVGFMNGVSGFAVGTELTLNADSTYREKMCGNIIVGKWTQEGDSLVLISDTMWYRGAKWQIEHMDANYDSIAGVRSHDRETFLIEQDRLVSISKGKRYRFKADGTKVEVKGYGMQILK